MGDNDPTKEVPDGDLEGKEPNEAASDPGEPLATSQKGGVLDAIVNLAALLSALDQKVDARLHDTRPLWEGVQSRLESIENQLSEISGKLERLEPDVKEIKRNQRALNDNFLSLQGRQSEAEERIDNLEKRVS